MQLVSTFVYLTKSRSEDADFSSFFMNPLWQIPTYRTHLSRWQERNNVLRNVENPSFAHIGQVEGEKNGNNEDTFF